MKKPILERALERGLFMSRWLMAPFYVGLIGAVVALMVVFFQDLAHEFPLLWSPDHGMDGDSAIMLALWICQVHVVVRDDPSDRDEHVVKATLLEEPGHPGHERHVCTRGQQLREIPTHETVAGGGERMGEEERGRHLCCDVQRSEARVVFVAYAAVVSYFVAWT